MSCKDCGVKHQPQVCNAKSPFEQQQDEIRSLRAELESFKAPYFKLSFPTSQRMREEISDLTALLTAQAERIKALEGTLREARAYLPSESEILDYAATNDGVGGPSGVLVRKIERLINDSDFARGLQTNKSRIAEAMGLPHKDALNAPNDGAKQAGE